MRFNAPLARRVALILGLSFPAFSNALADGRAVLPPKWMVEAYLSDALVKPSRDDIARAIIPGLGMMPAFMGPSVGPPPTFVNVGTEDNSAPGLPSGWAAGDLHIIVALQTSLSFPGTSITAHSTPAGWTSLITPIVGTNGGGGGNVINGGSKMQIFWRIAVGGDTAPSLSGGSGDYFVNYVLGYRGVLASGPIEASAATALTATGASTFAYDAITTLGGSRTVLQIFGGGGGPASSSPDSGWTERVDRSEFVSRICMGINEKTFAAAGAISGGNITFASAPDVMTRVALAILPA